MYDDEGMQAWAYQQEIEHQYFEEINKMNTELASVTTGNHKDYLAIVERLIATGDLSKLQPGERVSYYHKTCESLGLNPLTRPFEYITLNGKLTLYARKDATEQLRKLNQVSIERMESETIEGIYIVRAYAKTAEGRTDIGTGAVNITNLKGDALANAMMKAETKAKRRVTLSIVGLGWLDETEIETIPDAKVVDAKEVEGEIIQQKETKNIPELEQIKEANDIKTLQTVFQEIAKKFKNDKQKLEQVIKEKDLRKDVILKYGDHNHAIA